MSEWIVKKTNMLLVFGDEMVKRERDGELTAVRVNWCCVGVACNDKTITH